MTADLLRRAASTLRERAEAATPGLWSATPNRCVKSPHSQWVVASVAGRQYWPTMGDAEYIALLSPPVALALADLLDAHAYRADRRIEAERSVGVDEGATVTPEERAAVTLAQTVLRGPDGGGP